MAARTVVLVNTNEMKPPVAPLALDYLGDHLVSRGYDVRLIDLAFADDAASAIADGLADVDPLLIGLTFRNTDDCYLFSQEDFVPRLTAIVEHIRDNTSAPIVVGGCGFSIFPRAVLKRSGADFGIAGDGEAILWQFAERIRRDEDLHDLPGLLYRDREEIVFNPPGFDRNLEVAVTRSLVDNARYFREGAMGNIEAKRGCPSNCIYCADPVAKGRLVRIRNPEDVALEVETLLDQGVDVIHFCDGEFNIPPQHALAVCRELICRGLSEHIQWYCYASVHPFTRELADAMRRAGCVGINFGADHACDRMLGVLGKGYRAEAVREAVQFCRSAGILVMLDLLLGGPGETEASIRETIDFVKKLGPERCGAATGIRVYPSTPLADMVYRQGPLCENPHLRGHLRDNDDLLRPVFYVDAALGDDPCDIVINAIGGDERFFPPPRLKDARNYNYNDNRVLTDAIAAGHRGAFWDILRRIA